ncbi:MAG: PDZ domain-containing protein [Gammaproteobacteria bacterium]
MPRLVFALLFLVVFSTGPAFARASGHMVGVGIAIGADDDGSIWIEQVLPGGPADRAGVRADDELLAVDGRSVTGLAPKQVAAMIGGSLGSAVTLTVRAEEGRPRRLTMRRQRLSLGGPQTADSRGGARAGAGASAPRGSLRFRRISIRDPGIGNREAVSFLVPAGWRVAGGIRWMPNYSILANLLLRIRDPRSGAEIEYLPTQNFTWLTRPVAPMAPGTNYLGNIVWRPITDVPAFIRTFYFPGPLRHLQRARRVSVQALPGVARAVGRASGANHAVAARVGYRYTRDGRPWREDVFVTLVYYNSPMGTIWSVHSAYAMRAPRNAFARFEPTMAATVSSEHVSLDWYASYRYVQKLFENRMRRSIADAAAISRTVTRNSEEIRRMYDQSYREASASLERINRQFSEAIRGVNAYADPYKGRPVELPNGYRDVWTNSNGEYLLSNDANFNPNVGDNVEWKRMKTAGGR